MGNVRRGILICQETGQRILLPKKGGVHFGRYDGPGDLKIRPLPSLYKGAKVSIVIDDSTLEGDGETYTSRHQAFMRRKWFGGWGKWMLCDLNSKNGTRLNGGTLEPGKEYPVSTDDEITFADALTFRYTDEGSLFPYEALLLGTSGGTSRQGDRWVRDFNYRLGVQNDITWMEKVLEDRKFKLHTFLHDAADKMVILHKLNEIAGIRGDEGLFIFYYSGHGNEKGLNLVGGMLSPGELFDQLGMMEGEKLVILGCCHAGIFLKDVPPRTLVLAASGEEQLSYRGFVTGRPEMMNFYTWAIVDYLHRNPGKINLKELAEVAGADSRVEKHDQRPGAEGKTILLTRVRSEIGGF